MESREPIYLTRRGCKAVVLVDADEYGRPAGSERARLRAALDTKDGVERGYRDIAGGRTAHLDDALDQLEAR